jgi:hypothetical protein
VQRDLAKDLGGHIRDIEAVYLLFGFTSNLDVSCDLEEALSPFCTSVSSSVWFH